MSSDEVEASIRRNIAWNRLSDELRVMLGSSQREYDKRVLDYSIKNQLRYKGNIVRFVKKNEQEYYEQLLAYSQSKLMLYPYHLSDIMVRGLRVTPFNYYVNMMIDVMQAEKSYDSLPNFTAADAVRLLGIGRNQYIDLVNQSRSFRKLFRRSKTLREILPQKPVDVGIEPWYLLCYGCILENDIKLLTPAEKEVVDMLVDKGPQTCGLLDKNVCKTLFHRGLVYLEVPVYSDDYVYVPTLDGFVMNRVQGDYFETLLYKIFVTIDGQTTVKELSETIGIEEELVKNAVSVFCRLGFAKKRVTGLENVPLHSSWSEMGASITVASPTTDEPITLDLADLSTSLNNGTGDFDEDDELVSELENALSVDAVSNQTAASSLLSTPTPGVENVSRRVAFVFDSSLAAFLMMGNLSTSLKNHAVTLFEVGKLGDEAADNFVEELENVNFFVEGEVQRYSEHARTLLHTIKTLRASNELDLIRGESLLNLDKNALTRVIQKSYKLLVSMAPISVEAASLPAPVVPHLGTPAVQVPSPWFRLYIYSLIGDGPPSLFLPMGTRLTRLPSLFWNSRRLLVTAGTHEPMIVCMESALLPAAEALRTAPVFMQAYSDSVDDSEVVNVPLPFTEASPSPTNFCNHPALKQLREKLSLDTLCGYVVLVRLHGSSCVKEPTPDKDGSGDSDRLSTSETIFYTPTKPSKGATVIKDPRKVCSIRCELLDGETFADFVVLDCVFGIPLFDEQLNRSICDRLIEKELTNPECFERIKFANRDLVDSLDAFVKDYQIAVFEPLFDDVGNMAYPTQAIQFDPERSLTLPIY